MRIILSFLLVFLFISPTTVLAVTTAITNYPSSISNDSFTLDVSVSGATDGTNYLRVDIYKENTTNYFGETYNSTGWYGSSDGTQYFPVTIQSGSWSGSVQARMGSPTSTEYVGPGNYKLRIRRYTVSGNYTTSEANDSAITIAMTFATPSPTPPLAPSPTATPTPTASPVPTLPPAKTPSPTKTPTPTPTKSPTPSPTISPEPTPEEIVLGIQNTSLPSPSPDEAAVTRGWFAPSKILPFVLIVAGVGILGGALFSFVRQHRSLYNTDNNDSYNENKRRDEEIGD